MRTRIIHVRGLLALAVTRDRWLPTTRTASGHRDKGRATRWKTFVDMPLVAQSHGSGWHYYCYSISPGGKPNSLKALLGTQPQSCNAGEYSGGYLGECPGAANHTELRPNRNFRGKFPTAVSPGLDPLNINTMPPKKTPTSSLSGSNISTSCRYI